jgi:predicted alpha/beta hydrolase family esterase
VNTPCNLPYVEVEIDAAGNFVRPSQLEDIAAFVQSGSASISKPRNVFVMAHGWNTGMHDARSFYEYFFTQFCQTVSARGRTMQDCAVIGVLWPSLKFADAADIPGGAAALNDNPQAQRAFVNAVRATLPPQPQDEEGGHHLFGMPGDDVLDLLSAPIGQPALEEESGGGAQSIGSVLSRTEAAAQLLRNTVTYYQMKDRAAVVGKNAVRIALDRIQAFPQVRVHLIGHSFGCRVVTSAAANTAKSVDSMTLLQAAFSHNSFSPDYDSRHVPGMFRSVIDPGKVNGPILISHSVQDKAVGLAYAVASRLALQNGAAIGDANDPYGGLGRNGAQKTREATDGDLEPENSIYSFTRGKIYNLKADAIITAHGDIVKPQVANALIQAAGLV